MRFQAEKQIIRDHMRSFDSASMDEIGQVLRADVSQDYHWRGMHPFYELSGVHAVVTQFWLPLRKSLTSLQRREDIFFAGDNVVTPGEVWTCSMGHYMGLFDRDFQGIPATRKMAFLPYAEFHHVKDGKIVESALFIDLIRLMQQAGLNPIPHQTATSFVQPGPQTHDGIILGQTPAKEAADTLDLLDRMIADLSIHNAGDGEDFPREGLAATWHEDMIWYGPAGIGATYTIDRYQEQHQYPFRRSLTDKVFNGHVTRFAEGDYAGWFGWPNLNNRNAGGFLGLPKSDVLAEMRVVDIYRRDGDKLAENWVFIDILYYLVQHGIDLLADPDALKKACGEL